MRRFATGAAVGEPEFMWKLYHTPVRAVKPTGQLFLWRPYALQTELGNTHDPSVCPLPKPQTAIEYLVSTASPTLSGFDLFVKEFLAQDESHTADMVFDRAQKLSKLEKKQYADRAQQTYKFNKLSAYQCYLIDEQKRKPEQFKESKCLEKWNAMEPLRKKRWQVLAETQSSLKRRQPTGFQIFTREFFAKHMMPGKKFAAMQRESCEVWAQLSDLDKQAYSTKAKMYLVPPKITHKRGISAWDLFRKEKHATMSPADLLAAWAKPSVRAPYQLEADKLNKPKDEVETPLYNIFKSKVFTSANARLRAELPAELQGPERLKALRQAMGDVMRQLRSDFDKLSEADKEALQRDHNLVQKLEKRSQLGRGFYYD